MKVHPSAEAHAQAFVADGATIGAGCRIGPLSFVGAHVVLGEGVEIKPHAVVDGHTEVGDGTIIFPFASVGLAPQNIRYAGEPTRLILGRENIVREYVTLNTGTVQGGGTTCIGDKCMFHGGCPCGSRLYTRKQRNHGQPRLAGRSLHGW